MLPFIAEAARRMRVEHARLHSHIAASFSKDQSTVSRFEKGTGWSRDTDGLVAAYADDLGVAPREIWERALRLWREAEEGDASGENALAAAVSGRRARERVQARRGRSRDPGESQIPPADESEAG